MALLERNKIDVGGVEFDVIPGNEYLEISIGKEKKRVKRMDLWAMVFAISGPDEQEKMMPVRRTEVTHFTKVHVVKLKKDMKKDEIMKVRCHSSVETTVVEGIKGMLDESKKPGIMIA